MNNGYVPSNDRDNYERQTQAHERASAGQGVAATIDVLDRTRNTGSTTRWLTPTIIVAFWTLHYLFYSAFTLINDSEQMLRQYAVPRIIVSAFAIAISAAMVAILNRLRHRRLVFRAGAAVILTVIAPALHLAWANFVYAFFPAEPSNSPLWVGYAIDYLVRFWWFAALAAIILALSYVDDIREREERIGALQALAHDAQLRALRNQLNPHFLFNALNSIAGLISGRRDEEAESMTENLADFLRVTLALDPQKLITIAEETKLQQLYLDIEKVRFPHRLTVRLQIPEELEKVLVPSLITQPLIENSIKYAVARSTEPVELRICATAVSKDVLSLVIEDSGGNAEEATSKGAYFGIANVIERLKVHYGDAASLEAGARKTGGFRNTILLPIRRS